MPRPRVLHHGSLVLQRPALTPFVAAVHDSAATDDRLRSTLRAAIVRRVAERLDLEPTPGTLTAAEAALARQLANERYGNPDFVRQR